MDLNILKEFLEMLEEKYGVIGKYFGHILIWSGGVALLAYALKIIKDAMKEFGVVPLSHISLPSNYFTALLALWLLIITLVIYWRPVRSYIKKIKKSNSGDISLSVDSAQIKITTHPPDVVISQDDPPKNKYKIRWRYALLCILIIFGAIFYVIIRII